MTTLEAFQETVDIIRELEQSGIRVIFKPSKFKDDAECVARYSGPERIPPDKWCNVSFFPTTDDQKIIIHEKCKHLGWMGVGFDTGGCDGQRDWELDWSFRFVEKSTDHVPEEAREIVQDLLNYKGL